MGTTIVCPECGTQYNKVSPSLLGKTVRCAKCGNRFPAKSEVSSDQPESISATCPECGVIFRNIPVSFIGKTAKCKKCQSSFQVTTEPADSVAAERSGFRTEVESAEWATGDLILNLYEVTGILGQGGMGTVYRVRHRGWDMDLAVKSPKPDILRRAGGAENFIREAETWVNIGLHPHTVSCYYVRLIGGIPRVFAEYVEGGSLSDWIADSLLYRGAPQEALGTMIDAAIQFAWGLDYAHDQGLIHQDVKPANVMLTNEGLVKVTDFGLARARPMEGGGDEGDGRMTMMVDKVGMTPAYASPEQASGKKLTRRTDVWSYAVSILEMFTGEVMWPMGTVAGAFLESYLANGPENSSIPRMPQEMADILRQCFREDPEERPRTMGEVAEALVRIHPRIVGREYHRVRPKAGRDTADSLNNRAISLIDLGKTKEAEEAWLQALKIDPNHLETTFNQSMHLWKFHSILDEEVLRRLEQVRSDGPNAHRRSHILGKVYLFFGNYQQAVEHLSGAVDIEAPPVEYLRDLGLALSAKAESMDDASIWEKAEKYLRKVINSGHEDPAAITALTAALDRLGRTEESESLFLEARYRHHDMPVDRMEAARRILPGFEAASSASIPGPVHTLAFRPDGNSAVACSSDRIHELNVNGLTVIPKTANKTQEKLMEPIVISGNGQFVFSANPDQSIHRIPVARVGAYKKSKPVIGQVLSMAVSTDGKIALTGSSDRKVRLWDMETGQCTGAWEGHELFVGTIALARDLKTGLSGGGDGTIIQWRIGTGTIERSIKAHEGPITALAYCPGNHQFVSGGEDNHIRLWDGRSGECLREFSGITGPITGLAMTPDGRLLLAICNYYMLRVWNMETGHPHNVLKFDNRLTCLDVTPDSNYVLLGLAIRVARGGFTLKLVDLNHQYRSRIPYLVTMPVSASEADALSVQYRKKIDEARAHMKEENYAQAVQSVTEAREVPGYGQGREALEIWSDLTWRFPHKSLKAVWEKTGLHGHQGPVLAVAMFGRGEYAISGSQDNTLKIWDLKTGECLKTLSGHLDRITCVAVDTDGKTAVSGSWDNNIKVWDLDSGECRRTFDGHKDSITAAAVCPDGRYVLSAGRDQSLLLWEMNTGRVIRHLEGHRDYAATVAYSPDGRTALSGGWDKSLRLWDLNTGNCIQVLAGHESNLTAAAYSPDGLYALSGGGDKIVIRWALKTASQMRSLVGHHESVSTVGISPDGNYAISGGGDKTIRLWDLKSGLCLHTFEGHTAGISQAVFSPDGEYILSAGLDHTVRLWRLEWELEIRKTELWDEGARPHLINFLTLKTPLNIELGTRSGQPRWSESEREQLLTEMGYHGYGWLEPEGIVDKLTTLSNSWSGPPDPAQQFQEKLPPKAWLDPQILKLPVIHWKLTAAVLGILLFVLAISSVFYGRPDAPEGYGYMTFLTEKVDHPELEPVKHLVVGGDDSVARRWEPEYRGRFLRNPNTFIMPGEDQFLNDIELFEIHYIFRGPRLFKIKLYAKDKANYLKLQKHFTDKYGMGRQYIDPEIGAKGLAWNWRDPRITVAVAWSFADNVGYALYHYKGK